MSKKEESIDENIQPISEEIEPQAIQADETELSEVIEDETLSEVKEFKAENIEIEKPLNSDEEVDSDGTVTIKPVKFASFEDTSQALGEVNKNLDILMDIKLQLTVELGRTEMPVKKVLELTRGSIVELAKVAGEPVELYANGKLVAQGEVVVIEENFGLRITSITDPEDRLKGL